MLFRAGLRITLLLLKLQCMHVASVSSTRSLHQGLEICLHLVGRRRRLQLTITGVFPVYAWDQLKLPFDPSGMQAMKELSRRGTLLTVFVQQMHSQPWSRT